MAPKAYELVYWPTLQGRGELVRLALEDAGVPYVDVARLPVRRGGGEQAVLRALRAKKGFLPFAPPILRHDERVISQTANILAYVAPRHGLVPDDEASRTEALSLQLTIADLLEEAHDVHHPIAVGLYYEEQKREAKRAAAAFVAERLPRFLGYFESVLARGDGKHLLGVPSYVDLSLFQVVEGLVYAFPNATGRVLRALPRVVALHARVAARPRIAAYLASPRRIPFNEEGIFRHYSELDARPDAATKARRAR